MITTLLRCVTIMRFNKLAISNRAENILNPSTSKLLPCTTIIRIDRDNHRDLRGNFFVSKMTRKHRQQRIQQERRRDHLQVLLYASGLPSIQTQLPGLFAYPLCETGLGRAGGYWPVRIIISWREEKSTVGRTRAERVRVAGSISTDSTVPTVSSAGYTLPMPLESTISPG